MENFLAYPFELLKAHIKNDDTLKFLNEIQKHQNIVLGATIGFYITLFVVLVFLPLFLLKKAVSSKKKNVLLLGISGTGKTKLFYKLGHQRDVEVQSSMKENVAQLNSNLELIDIPGHYRLRNFQSKAAQTKGIVFLVKGDFAEDAKYLYEVLTCKQLCDNKTKLLICLNGDLEESKRRLEVQVELIRRGSSKIVDENAVTKSNIIDLPVRAQEHEYKDVDEEDDEEEQTLDENEESKEIIGFDFGICPLNAQFIERKDETLEEDVKQFISNLN